jgi:transposase
MEEQPTCNVQNLGHLGILAAIFKEFKIVERIDSLLPKKSNNQNITHGEVIQAMVMQGLGFSNHRLYLSAEFFSHVAMDSIFNSKIKFEYFTADTIGRTLDAIFKYGPTKFFTDLCLNIVIENKLLKKFFYIDTTSLYTTGKKYKNTGNIELKRGYSKDHRMDLKQLVYLLVTTDEGLPIFAESHSGNASDNELFQKAIIKVQNLVKDQMENQIFVLDAALYSKEFLLNPHITGDWVTRVPESIKLCKEYLERDYDKLLWTKVDKDFKFVELESTYGGIKQRWILVRNREAKYKELATFKKQLDKEKETIESGIKKLEKKIFFTKEEAAREMENHKTYHQHFIFTYKIQGICEKVKTNDREKIVRIGYNLSISFKRDETRIKKTEMKKGKFILAASCLDDEKLSASDILGAYRGRNKNSEGCFKFIKDKTHNLNQIFLKKESRIEAMVTVMSIILFINNLAQKKLRDFLIEKDESITSQLGRGTKNPTFKWASYLMRNITKVKIEVAGKIYDQIKGIKKVQETIIRAFGDYALEIYGLT